MSEAKYAILGGSGLYELAGLEQAREVRIDTPFGAPSAPPVVGRIGDLEVAFLARHGRDHHLLPSEINYRANIFSLKLLGVERILSASAVGSMRESVRPRDVVLIDQFIDRTHHRESTFFGSGLVAHVTLADPICPELREHLGRAAADRTARVHVGGTYLCIEGPAFSTRAESRLYRSWDVDVIGMTNLQEAKLAREAEICYGTLALVTDYDCWHEDEDDVSVEALLDNLRANASLAAEVLRETLRLLPKDRETCQCGSALSRAIITPLDAVPGETRTRLEPLVGKYLRPAGPGTS